MWGTVIVGAIVLGLAGLAAGSVFKDFKSGKSCGSCSSCKMGCASGRPDSKA